MMTRLPASLAFAGGSLKDPAAHQFPVLDVKPQTRGPRFLEDRIVVDVGVVRHAALSGGCGHFGRGGHFGQISYETV
jgi:hypothetical protein